MSSIRAKYTEIITSKIFVYFHLSKGVHTGSVVLSLSEEISVICTEKDWKLLEIVLKINLFAISFGDTNYTL